MRGEEKQFIFIYWFGISHVKRQTETDRAQTITNISIIRNSHNTRNQDGNQKLLTDALVSNHVGNVLGCAIDPTLKLQLKWKKATEKAKKKRTKNKKRWKKLNEMWHLPISKENFIWFNITFSLVVVNGI